jgi:hypothetical protein
MRMVEETLMTRIFIAGLVALISAVLLVAAVPAVCTAGWEPDGVLVSPTTAWDHEPQVVPDGAGGSIVVWHDGGRVDLARLDAAGDRIWGPVGAAYFPGLRVTELAAVSDSAAGAIVAYAIFDLINFRHLLYANRVSANGVKLWGSDGVRLAITSINDLAIVSDGANGAIVVWSDYRGDGDIYARRVDSQGQVLWADNGIPVCNVGGEQTGPTCVEDGSGGVLVAWRDSRHDSRGDVYAQRVSGQGSLQWTGEGLRVTPVSGENDSIQATAVSGGIVLAWVGLGPPGRSLQFQRVDVSGNRLWGSGGVQSSCAVKDGMFSLASGYPDGAAVAFVGGPDASQLTGVRVQRVGGSGGEAWGDGGVPVMRTDLTQPGFRKGSTGAVRRGLPGAAWQPAG